MYRPGVVIDALNRGMHVFCEIPPVRTLRDMQDIIAAEKGNERLVSMGNPTEIFREHIADQPVCHPGYGNLTLI